MMTKMRTKGRICPIGDENTSPIPPTPCANAGEINIEILLPHRFGAVATTVDHGFTAGIGADYTGRGPNCNAAAMPLRQSLRRRHGLAKARAEELEAFSMSRAKPDFGGESFAATLDRIADALDRLAPRTPAPPAFDAADAFAWHPEGRRLTPVERVNRVDMALLKGIDRVRDVLVENTQRFARGLPANNALLWGARGMGKSSLVKAAHATVNSAARSRGSSSALKLIEIHREDIESLPDLMTLLRPVAQYRFLLFCDDLSFDAADTSYKSLKALLEGGIEGRPDNLIFYATSNRRHLLPRGMMENERSTAINPAEAVEEKVSLSDRFGLWLGFHRCSQDEYLAMVGGYVAHYRIPVADATLRAEALEWATTRGSRSGRVAWQFVQDLAGRLGIPLEPAT
jgi:predicted AAA+ superfamily ATPase